MISSHQSYDTKKDFDPEIQGQGQYRASIVFPPNRRCRIHLR